MLAREGGRLLRPQSTTTFAALNVATDYDHHSVPTGPDSKRPLHRLPDHNAGTGDGPLGAKATAT